MAPGSASPARPNVRMAGRGKNGEGAGHSPLSTRPAGPLPHCERTAARRARRRPTAPSRRPPAAVRALCTSGTRARSEGTSPPDPVLARSPNRAAEIGTVISPCFQHPRQDGTSELQAFGVRQFSCTWRHSVMTASRQLFLVCLCLMVAVSVGAQCTWTVPPTGGYMTPCIVGIGANPPASPQVPPQLYVLDFRPGTTTVDGYHSSVVSQSGTQTDQAFHFGSYQTIQPGVLNSGVLYGVRGDAFISGGGTLTTAIASELFAGVTPNQTGFVTTAMGQRVNV